MVKSPGGSGDVRFEGFGLLPSRVVPGRLSFFQPPGSIAAFYLSLDRLTLQRFYSLLSARPLDDLL